MDALTAHVFALFGLCTAPATRASFARASLLCPDCGRNTAHRRVKSRLWLPHPAGGVQTARVRLCTGAFSRRCRPTVGEDRKHYQRFRTLAFAPPSSCGHWDILRGYTAPHGLKGRNNRKERKSERDMVCGITTTILIVAPQISAQCQLYTISKKLATSRRNLSFLR